MKERKKGMNEMAKKRESTPGERLAKQTHMDANI